MEVRSQGIQQIVALRSVQICEILNTKMLIGHELCADSITRPKYGGGRNRDWQRAQAAKDRHATGSHVKNVVMPFGS